MSQSKIDYMTGVRESHDKAKSLLENPTEQNIKYVALELRMCIEGVVYNDVQSYPEGSLPSEALTKWQPNKLVSHMLSIDLNYMDNAALILAPQGELIDVDGKLNKEAMTASNTKFPEGWGKFRQANFKKKITHKMYHALGNILHVPTIKQMQNGVRLEKRIKTCQEVLESVEERLNATLGNVALWQSLSHECVDCGSKNIFPFLQTISGNERIFQCLNTDCSAEYLAKQIEEGSYEIKPYGRITQCFACKKGYVVWRSDFIPDKTVNCTHCNEPHLVGVGTVSERAIKQRAEENKSNKQ